MYGIVNIRQTLTLIEHSAPCLFRSPFNDMHRSMMYTNFWLLKKRWHWWMAFLFTASLQERLLKPTVTDWLHVHGYCQFAPCSKAPAWAGCTEGKHQRMLGMSAAFVIGADDAVLLVQCSHHFDKQSVCMCLYMSLYIINIPIYRLIKHDSFTLHLHLSVPLPHSFPPFAHSFFARDIID